MTGTEKPEAWRHNIELVLIPMFLGIMTLLVYTLWSAGLNAGITRLTVVAVYPLPLAIYPVSFLIYRRMLCGSIYSEGRRGRIKRGESLDGLSTKVMQEVKFGYRVNSYEYSLPLLVLIAVTMLGFYVPLYEFIRFGHIGVLELVIAAFSGNATLAVHTSSFEWGFLGAYVHSLFSIMHRVTRKDVSPRFYLNTAVRLVVAPLIATLIGLVPEFVGFSTIHTTGTLTIISFSAGMFPYFFLRYIQNKIHITHDRPLNDIPGISLFEASRLWEENVLNISILANMTPRFLHKHTHYPEDRLRHIIGSAILYDKVGGDVLVKDGKVAAKKEADGKTRSQILREDGILTIMDLVILVEQSADAISEIANKIAVSEDILALMVDSAVASSPWVIE